MKLMFVYGVLPAIIWYTNNISEGFGGYANGPLVRLLKKYEEIDEGILQHELVHVKQWYRTLFTHGIWYILFEKYRLQSEVEAYKKQASYYDYDALPWMTNIIYTKYSINNYSKEQILSLLKH
jgi:hypothetical protein